MNKFKEMLREYKESKRNSYIVYISLRLFVILCMVSQLLRGELENAFLCLMSMMLFTLPMIFRKRYKVELPSLLEIIIYLFIFSAQILGSIYNFYGNIPHWDTILHTINGFICAGIGFSLIDLLNKKSKRVNLSPFYVAFVAFCFSMTVGVCWEFYEYGMDKIILSDTQNDLLLTTISSKELNQAGTRTVKIHGIAKTVIYDDDNEILTIIEGGYLDVGINDTMKDLIVNFIGAVTFSLIGYLYIQNRDKYLFAGNFIPRKGIEKGEIIC